MQDQEGELVQLEDSFKKDHKSELSPEGVQPSLEGVKKVRFEREIDKNIEKLMEPTLIDINQLTRRKSSRMMQPSVKVWQSEDKTVKKMYGLVTKEDGLMMNSNKENSFMVMLTHCGNMKTLFDSTINEYNAVIFNVLTTNNDVYTLRQMLKLQDIKEFVIAMQREIQDHQVRDHWELFLQKNQTKGAKKILSVWAFKVKRYPDGRILKHKATYTAVGSAKYGQLIAK